MSKPNPREESGCICAPEHGRDVGSCPVHGTGDGIAAAEGVLAGQDSYDDLPGDAQAIVRAHLDQQLAADIAASDLTAELRASGKPFYTADEDGSVIKHEPDEMSSCTCPDPQHGRLLRSCPVHGVVAEEERLRTRDELEAEAARAFDCGQLRDIVSVRGRLSRWRRHPATTPEQAERAQQLDKRLGAAVTQHLVERRRERNEEILRGGELRRSIEESRDDWDR